jgi:hypothetical protein
VGGTYRFLYPGSGGVHGCGTDLEQRTTGRSKDGGQHRYCANALTNAKAKGFTFAGNACGTFADNFDKF